MRGTSSTVESLTGWPVSVLSSTASSPALASMASASASSSRPRSAAAVRRQAGNAVAAASTARSTSAARASAISVRTEQSWGLRTSIVAPSTPSTNSPPMNSLFWNAISGRPG